MESNISELLSQAFSIWEEREGSLVDSSQEAYTFFIHTLKDNFQMLMNTLGYSGFLVEAGVGKGRWGSIPWILVRHPDDARAELI